MDENTNPSVVQGEMSNYNIARNPDVTIDPFNMFNTQQYINQMQEMSKVTPVGNPLSSADYYPGAGRGIQVGSTSSQTLGGQPIFAAGKGLIPFEVLQNFRRAKADAQMTTYSRMQPEQLDVKVSELANIDLQPQWNEFIKTGVDTWLTEYTRSTGNPIIAQKALKNDRNFQKWLGDMEFLSKSYNKVYSEAIDILTDAPDPVKGITKEQVDYAKEFVNGVDKSLFGDDKRPGELDTKRLTKTIENFQGRVNVGKLADAVTKDVGERVKGWVQAHPAYNTNRAKAFQEIKEKKWSEDEVTSLIEAAASMSSYDLNEEEKKTLGTLVRSKLDQTREATLKSLSQQEVTFQDELRTMGVPTDKDGNIQFSQGTSAVGAHRQEGTAELGRISVNEVIGIPQKVKNAQGVMQEVKVDIPNASMVTVVNTQTGETIQGYTRAPLQFRPSRGYNADGTEGVVRQYEGLVDFGTKELDPETKKPVQRGTVITDQNGNPIDLYGHHTVALSYDIVQPQLATYYPAITQLDEIAIAQGTTRFNSPKTVDGKKTPATGQVDVRAATTPVTTENDVKPGDVRKETIGKQQVRDDVLPQPVTADKRPKGGSTARVISTAADVASSNVGDVVTDKNGNRYTVYENNGQKLLDPIK